MEQYINDKLGINQEEPDQTEQKSKRDKRLEQDVELYAMPEEVFTFVFCLIRDLASFCLSLALICSEVLACACAVPSNACLSVCR
jgi:hypothetical protein